MSLYFRLIDQKQFVENQFIEWTIYRMDFYGKKLIKKITSQNYNSPKGQLIEKN